jgi:ABC-type bacteriocin/lantibiotic exporter with double-glycine peptidase domain
MTFYRQETKFTCGPASIRNCLLTMGYNFSERKIRRLAGTDKINGTNEKRLTRALKHLGFDSREIYNKSESAFKQRLLYNLKKGNKLIILTDHEDHWISVVDYENKYLRVIDPQEKRVKKMLTPKELSRWCLNFNKKTRETYFYGIVIIAPHEDNNE